MPRRDVIARELRGTRHIHLALFAGKPIADRRLAKRADVLLFTPEDLLSSDVVKGP